MNIAIASDDGTHVARHLGRTRGFVIFTQKDGGEEQRYIENTFTQHGRGNDHGHQHGSGSGHHGGHHHSHAGILEALRGCEIVVSGGMGMRLREDFREAKIQAVLTDHDLVEDVIVDARSGMLVHNEERSCGH